MNVDRCVYVQVLTWTEVPGALEMESENCKLSDVGAETRLLSAARAVSFLNCKAVSPVPRVSFQKGNLALGCLSPGNSDKLEPQPFCRAVFWVLDFELRGRLSCPCDGLMQGGRRKGSTAV